MTELSASPPSISGPDQIDANMAAPAQRSEDQVGWFAALALFSVVLAAVGCLAGSEALKLIGGYGALIFGVGGAPFQLRAGVSLLTRTAGSFVVGFSVLMVGGGLMADLHGLWHPIPATVIVGVAAAALHVVGVRRALRAGTLVYRPARLDPQVLLAPLRENRWSLGLTVLGLVLCLARASMVFDPHPTWWGFLPLVGPVWFLGFGLILAGFAVGFRNELSAGAAVTAIGLVSTLTPAIVYRAPRSPTAEKQMWLTQHVIQHHHIVVTAGIYPAYSAFFSGIAWLSSPLGIHGMLGSDSLWGLATYWPVVMALGRVAVLRMMMQSVTPTTARRWTAVMLVLLTDSISDANYFSPQSLGYVLGFGAIAFGLRGPGQRQLGTKWTAALLILAGVALAPTHEISPYMVAGALLLLYLFRQAPWWGWITILAPALAWTGLVHKAVSQYFSFSTLFDLSNFAPPKTYAAPGLSRLPIIGYQSHSLLVALVILILLGGATLLANLRTRWAWAYWLSAGTGLGMIAVNPYGDEGIFRAALFGIPWLAALAVRAPIPSVLPKIAILRRRVATPVALFVVCAALGGLFLVASYSLDVFNVLGRGEVAADLYLQHRHEGSLEMDVESGTDSGNTLGAYNKFVTIDWSDVARGPQFETLHPTAQKLQLLTLGYTAFAQKNGVAKYPRYILWSGALVPYVQGYGLGTRAQMYAWLNVLKHSDQWRLVFHRGDNYLFRFVAAAQKEQT